MDKHTIIPMLLLQGQGQMYVMLEITDNFRFELWVKIKLWSSESDFEGKAQGHM